MVARISVNDSEAVRETIAALKLANKNVQKQIRAQSKRVIEPVYKEALATAAGSTRSFYGQGIIQSARVKISEQNVTVSTGSTKGKFRNGLDMRKSIRSMEFGSSGGRKTTYNRKSRRGGTHKVTRLTMGQFGPKAPKGRVFYPAVRELAPRVISLWVQTVIREYADALERK
jgi:hypothetical protein